MSNHEPVPATSDGTANPLDAPYLPKGGGGTLCTPAYLQVPIYVYQGGGRFKWLKQFIHTLKYGCD